MFMFGLWGYPRTVILSNLPKYDGNNIWYSLSILIASVYMLCAGRPTVIVFYYFVFKLSRNDCFGPPLRNFRRPARSNEGQ
jgi:hypothetical protein